MRGAARRRRVKVLFIFQLLDLPEEAWEAFSRWR